MQHLDDGFADRDAIRAIIEAWVICRDSGLWGRFAGLWHDNGVMCSTWKQSSASDFIEACRQGWAKGLNVTHVLGACALEVRGDRAVAQTRMTIIQRAMLDAEWVDVTCHGRFYDLFESRNGRWGILLRQPIYERDRLDAVTPG